MSSDSACSILSLRHHNTRYTLFLAREVRTPPMVSKVGLVCMRNCLMFQHRAVSVVARGIPFLVISKYNCHVRENPKHFFQKPPIWRFHFFRGLNKLLMSKAPELSRFSRWRFEDLARDLQTPKVEGPRVTCDSSEAVPAF